MPSYSSERRTFVVDTSVLAHHGESIYGFAGHNVYLPIEVLEELDNLKNRMDSTGAACRYVNRYLDQLREKGNLAQGVKLDNEQVIYTASFSDMQLMPAGLSDTNDNRIISIAAKLIRDGQEATIVSRDISLRVRCDSLGIPAIDYRKNSTSKTDYFYNGIVEIETTKTVINKFYKEGVVSVQGYDLYPNQGVILKAGQSSAIAIAESSDSVRKFYYANEKGFEVEGISARSKEQLLALELLMDPEIHMISLTGMAGCGKAQPLSSKVMTPEGWTTIGDLKAGDQVVGRDGNPAIVLETFPQGKKAIYKIKFNDGTFTESCAEHLWYTWTQRDRDFKRNGSVKSLNKIMESLRDKNGKKNHSVPVVEPISFANKVETRLDPYLLGCLIGKGHLEDVLSISIKDSEILNLFNLSGFNLECISGHNYGILVENSYLNIKGELRKLNLLKRSPEDRFVPNLYKYNSVDNRLKLLRGLMDTKGSVSNDGYKTNFVSASKRLAQDVCDIVRSLGGKAILSSRFTTYTSKGIEKRGKESYRVGVYLPESMCPFRLSKQKGGWRPTKDVNLRKYIDSVEYIGDKEAKCIYIDNSDHLYVTDDYIVTHNTLLAIASAMSHIHSGEYNKLIISRPVQSTSKDIGFLPGPQPLDAKVLTPSGWTTMGEINKGDYVISRDGAKARVLGVFPKGEKDVYEITTSDGRKTEACIDHLWLTETLRDKKDGFSGSVKTTEQIMNSLRDPDFKNKLNHFLPRNAPVIYNSVEMPIPPYTLGSILGGGFLYHGTCSLLKEKLEALGLAGKELGDKFIPEQYLYNSLVEDRIALLYGLMDADGSVKTSTGESTYYTASRQLAKDVVTLVRSLGGNADFCMRKSKVGLRVRRDDSYIVSVRLNINPFHLSRNAKLYKKECLEDIKIESIKLAGKKEVQCILIDNEEHLYITDDFIVTHNTKEEKMSPWLQPIFDNLSVIFPEKGTSYIDLLIERGKIEVEALTYVRGRTLPNTIFIVDEAQNITHHEAKALLTRMGEGSKIILIGDLEQIDSPLVDQKTSGLFSVVELFKEFKHSGHVRLLKGERSKLATFAAKVM